MTIYLPLFVWTLGDLFGSIMTTILLLIVAGLYIQDWWRKKK